MEITQKPLITLPVFDFAFSNETPDGSVIASVGSIVSTRTTSLLTRTPQLEQLSYPSAMTPTVPNIKPPILAPDGARGLASPVAYRGTRVRLHQEPSER